MHFLCRRLLHYKNYIFALMIEAIGELNRKIHDSPEHARLLCSFKIEEK